MKVFTNALMSGAILYALIPISAQVMMMLPVWNHGQ